jgi:hypothetical protein
VFEEHILIALVELAQIVDVVVVIQRADETLFQFLRIFQQTFELSLFLGVVTDFEHFVGVFLLF